MGSTFEENNFLICVVISKIVIHLRHITRKNLYSSLDSEIALLIL